jgi:hypothetical protein
MGDDDAAHEDMPTSKSGGGRAGESAITEGLKKQRKRKKRKKKKKKRLSVLGFLAT